MNKPSPKIRQNRVKMPSSTRHSQNLNQEAEFFFSPKYKDTSPTQSTNKKAQRKIEVLPKIKGRISRAKSIL